MPKHTPGPWRSYGRFVATSTPDVKTDREIAACETSDGRAEANARLIAAAPKMLEALKAIEPWLSVAIQLEAFKECAGPNSAVRAMRQARAAIEEATE